ncbi:MAG: hypothetical protein ABH828_01865 [archaeon]
MKWIIIALILAIGLMTACTEETTTADKTVIVDQGGEAAGTELVEIMMDGSNFNPDTIVVNFGDTLRLQFMNSEAFTFSLPEYGIAERVSSSQLEFVADQKGVFEYACLDCDNSVVGVLKVI